jgi:hypothetical protein
MDIVKITAGTSTNRYQRAALVLRALDWMSIVWGAMISIYDLDGRTRRIATLAVLERRPVRGRAILSGIARRLQSRAANSALKAETELGRPQQAA